MLGLVGWLASSWMFSTTLVSVGKIHRGSMQVSVEEDGKTRIRERYVVSSPLMGKLVRIELQAGDAVVARESIVATIQPPAPAMLDPRQLAQAESAAQAARLAVDQAKFKEHEQREQQSLAEKTLDRLQRLGSTVAQQDLESAETDYRSYVATVSAACLATQIADFQWQQAQAALLHLRSDEATRTNYGSGLFQVQSPVSGKVLRVMQESSSVVQAGTPLLELGNPADLEIEVDVLSSQAVRIAVGNQVIIEHWGGDVPLHGVVRRVEPAGFTKISALGVEEQRVNVIIDFVEPFAQRATLGDAYRVEASIVVWSAEDVLQVPTGALFRTQDQWSVFAIVNGILQLREIQIGQRNRHSAQVLRGLNENENVVLHPTDQLQPGIRVREQP